MHIEDRFFIYINGYFTAVQSFYDLLFFNIFLDIQKWHLLSINFTHQKEYILHGKI